MTDKGTKIAPGHYRLANSQLYCEAKAGTTEAVLSTTTREWTCDFCAANLGDSPGVESKEPIEPTTEYCAHCGAHNPEREEHDEDCPSRPTINPSMRPSDPVFLSGFTPEGKTFRQSTFAQENEQPPQQGGLFEVRGQITVRYDNTPIADETPTVVVEEAGGIMDCTHSDPGVRVFLIRWLDKDTEPEEGHYMDLQYGREQFFSVEEIGGA